MKQIAKLQYITRDNDQYSHAEQARLMFEYGINWVQLRMKKNSEIEVLEQAELALRYAKRAHGQLIINDYVNIVKTIGAHGVHLGLNDLPICQAREILGNDIIIGGTANTIEDIKLQVSRGADYVGLGPFRFTETKENLSSIIGIEGYKDIMKELQNLKLNVPMVAVGGIKKDDIEHIINTGIYGIAISGSLFNQIIKQKHHG